MKLYRLAAKAIALRGYKYYEQNKVLRCVETAPGVFEGEVAGSAAVPYRVSINTADGAACACSCPFADRPGKICKHMIALSFAAEPAEAEIYYNAYVKPAFEAELRREQQEHALMEYVADLDAFEAKRLLVSLLLDGPEYQYHQFLREYLGVAPDEFEWSEPYES